MNLVQVVMILALLAPHSTVYVKGHSQEADKVRVSLEMLTCYRTGVNPESSDATLEVDHILAKSGRRSWVVMSLVDTRNRVLWQEKAEELPWPLPSSLRRLLRHLAESSCSGGCSGSGLRSLPRKRRTTGALACSQSPAPTLALHAVEREEPSH